MSDGSPASGGAPATASTGAPAQGAAPTTPDAPPAWTDKDDAAFVEMLKRSPHAKLKVDGKEQTIGSIEELQRLKLDAMRGRGAARVVEDAKREAAEAKRIREEASTFADMVRKAQMGDKEARKALRLIPDDEAEQQRQKWEALPPEVKAVLQRNAELEQLMAEREQSEAQAKEDEENRKREALKASTLQKAKEYAKAIFEDIQEDMHDVVLPEVIAAMKELHGRKLKMGVDYGIEQLKALVQDRRQRGVDSQLGLLKPEALLKRTAGALLSLKPDQLIQALGDEQLDKLGRALSRAYLAKHKAATAKPAQVQAAPKPTRREEPSAPLSPFRFNR